MPPPINDTIRVLLASQHGVAARQQLLEAGLTDRRIATLIKHRRLVRLVAGGYADADVWRAASAERRHCMLLLAVQQVAPDAIGQGATAAIAWGLPTRAIPAAPAVLRQPRRSALTGVRVRRAQLAEHQVTRHADLRVTTLARTVADVAADESLPDALITIDAALRRGLDPGRLTAELATFSQRRAKRATAAISAGDPASESPLESLSRGRELEHSLPQPLCNVVIRCGGRWFRVDQLWAELGIVGECDGRQKYLDDPNPGQVIWKEKRRHEWLEDLSLMVIRWGYPDVASHGEALVQRFERAARRQARYGFTWRADVSLEVPALPDVRTPQRVLHEVARLQAANVPITIESAELSDYLRFRAV